MKIASYPETTGVRKVLIFIFASDPFSRADKPSPDHWEAAGALGAFPKQPITDTVGHQQGIKKQG